MDKLLNADFINVFNSTLDKINVVICAIVGVAFLFQIFYLFLFFLPARKYPEAKEKHKVGVVICARNEEEIISRTIKTLQKLNYPKDKFEIIVMADNCTDNTAELARALDGDVKVRVFERHETNKKLCNIGGALNYLFEQLMPEIDNYDFFVRFDADSIADSEYLNKMNNAFEAGAMTAKGYNHASNLTQNVIAGVSGLWYIRDSRFNCQARSALHTDVFLVGSGMMFSAECIKQDGGWVAIDTSEDIAFTLQHMKKKRKIHYVADAILYDDQPSTMKDLFRRNIRMGHSLHNLFWREGFPCLFRFFTTFRYCWLDMFLNLFFIPIAVICCIWFPIYYAYTLFFNWFAAAGDPAVANETLKFILIILFCAFIIPFILQALLVYFLDRKKINQPFKKVAGAIFAFPMFMIIWAISIVIGVFSKQQWKQVKRNVNYNDYSQNFEAVDINPLEEKKKQKLLKSTKILGKSQKNTPI